MSVLRQVSHELSGIPQHLLAGMQVVADRNMPAQQSAEYHPDSQTMRVHPDRYRPGTALHEVGHRFQHPSLDSGGSFRSPTAKGMGEASADNFANKHMPGFEGDIETQVGLHGDPRGKHPGIHTPYMEMLDGYDRVRRSPVSESQFTDD